MVNYFYLIFATLVSQSGTNEAAFYADSVTRHTTNNSCLAAMAAADDLVVIDEQPSITPRPITTNHVGCVQVPTINTGNRFNLVVQYWGGKRSDSKILNGFKIENIASSAACVDAGEAIETSIEAKYTGNVFVDYKCIPVN